MASGIRGSKRGRGEIEDLASGALRVKVYAGIDPISKKRLYLRETVPAGPSARRQAEKVRTRLLNEVYERRNPRTDATVAQLIDRHIAEAKLGIKTRINYRSQADKHIVPCIGGEKVRAVDAALSDSFYAELRRCREHCDGRPRIDHRTAAAHDCDDRTPDASRPIRVDQVERMLAAGWRPPQDPAHIGRIGSAAAARLLGWSKSEVTQRARDERLPAVRDARGRWWFDPDQLAMVVRARRSEELGVLTNA